MPIQISRNGQLYGPYTPEDIQRYLASGHILTTDLARPDDSSPWVPLADLLPASSALPPPPLPPPAVLYRGPFADAAPITGEYLFFPVSPLKFAIMSLCTFGLYYVYWAYKNWQVYQRHVDATVSPVLRAIFLGIWNFPLFSRVAEKAADKEIPVIWRPVVLGILVILFSVSSRLPHAWSLLSLLSFLGYLPVVRAIDRINRKHAPTVGLPLNRRFTAWNIAGIVFGSLLLALSFLGAALPTDKPATAPSTTTTVDVAPPS